MGVLAAAPASRVRDEVTIIHLEEIPPIVAGKPHLEPGVVGGNHVVAVPEGTAVKPDRHLPAEVIGGLGPRPGVVADDVVGDSLLRAHEIALHIVEVERALEMVQQFHPIQRVFLTCTGTLQGTLSAWFGGPMQIHVIAQTQEGRLNLDWVARRVIKMEFHGRCMMKAESVITTSREDVRDLLLEKQLGLGQIMEKLGIRPEFKLVEANQDYETFWRVYQLLGSGVTYRIREEVPQCYYRSASWGTEMGDLPSSS